MRVLNVLEAGSIRTAYFAGPNSGTCLLRSLHWSITSVRLELCKYRAKSSKPNLSYTESRN
jgi:hypothetical protein